MPKRLALVLALAFIIIAATALPTLAASVEELEAAARDTAAYLIKTVPEPSFGVVGGEWLVMGLARSSVTTPQGYLDGYVKRVEAYVKSCRGVLHERKYSEYARLVLALSALGQDPTNIGGYNLLLPLADYEKTTWQGINGAIFALLALDSRAYEIPQNKQAATQATRELYVQYILSRELSTGGFSLAGETADPDVTAMAVQALAKYQQQPAVAAAISRAVTRLSALQGADGGFVSWSSSNCESVVQVIVAMAELGLSPADSRFVKNGISLTDNLLSFYKKGKGFAHDGALGANLLASEQGFYALISLQRYAAGQNSLYTMTEEQPVKAPAPPPSARQRSR